LLLPPSSRAESQAARFAHADCECPVLPFYCGQCRKLKQLLMAERDWKMNGSAAAKISSHEFLQRRP